MATEYGKRLRQARKYAKLTQVQLSEKTGVPQSTISTAEREGNGSSETPVYAHATGVNALWLATGEGEMLGITGHAAAATVTSLDKRKEQRRRTSDLEVVDGFIDLLARAEAPVLEALAGLLPALARNPCNQQIVRSVKALFEPEAFAEKVQHKG